MKEIRDIIQAFDTIQNKGGNAALATVVHVEGSAYRRPGARMLISDTGQLTGAISGGCLEGDALRKALLAMEQKQNKLITYDTTDEAEHHIGVQLGCSGIIHILIEPIEAGKENNPIALLRSTLALPQKAALVTLFSLPNRTDTQAGTCLLQLENGTVVSNLNNPFLQDVLTAETTIALTREVSSMKKFSVNEKEGTAFIEFIKPEITLIIIGAGNDAVPLVQMAAVLGWQITVIDGRPAYANRRRFSEAHSVIAGKMDSIIPQLNTNRQTAFVIMTHNYNSDLTTLKQVVQKEVSYIGLLGPKKKLERILEELKDEGMDITREQVIKLHGPVGLDIGAETAEEIALSILAEIKMVLSNKSGEPLRNKQGSIHSNDNKKIEDVVVSQRVNNSKN